MAKTRVSAAIRAASKLPSVSVGDFTRLAGHHLLGRTKAFFEWREARRERGTWPYARTLVTPPSAVAEVVDDQGRGARGVNFASQDHLSLATHPAVIAAAHTALDQFGTHSAGSPIFLGNTSLSRRLETKLAEHLDMQECLLFASGWAAGFSTIGAFVRPADHVVIDEHAQPCLQRGANTATRNVSRFKHGDVEILRNRLKRIRMTAAHAGILVVTEALFGIDADVSDLVVMQTLCREHGATLLVHVANDLGMLGPDGTGVLGAQGVLGSIDVVTGSFGRAFATNGGFACVRTRSAMEYLRFFGESHYFSNAMSPVQTAVALEALRILRSDEGAERRRRLLDVVRVARDTLTEVGVTVLGESAPFVPVAIGSDEVARVASMLAGERGLLVNLAEHPAAPTGDARFQLELMADHDTAQVAAAMRDLGAALDEAYDVVIDARQIRRSTQRWRRP